MLLMRHAAILVTGISGVGKSTALTELARRGFTTVDTDYGPWIHVVDGEPLWRQLMIDALLDRPRDTPLFVQGSVANQGRFYSRSDAVVLLSAPALRFEESCPDRSLRARWRRSLVAVGLGRAFERIGGGLCRLSRIGGGHTLYVYARSAVSGRETVVSFPVAVGNR